MTAHKPAMLLACALTPFFSRMPGTAPGAGFKMDPETMKRLQQMQQQYAR